MQRALSSTRRAIAAVVALAVVCAALASASAPPAEASSGLMYFRDGVGASAKVSWRKRGDTVKYKGRIWDRKGDGWHASIYGYSLGHPWLIRKATRGRSGTFSGEAFAPLFFEVCTFNRSTEITCTRRWTHN